MPASWRLGNPGWRGGNPDWGGGKGRSASDCRNHLLPRKRGGRRGGLFFLDPVRTMLPQPLLPLLPHLLDFFSLFWPREHRGLGLHLFLFLLLPLLWLCRWRNRGLLHTKHASCTGCIVFLFPPLFLPSLSFPPSVLKASTEVLEWPWCLSYVTELFFYLVFSLTLVYLRLSPSLQKKNILPWFFFLYLSPISSGLVCSVH